MRTRVPCAVRSEGKIIVWNAETLESEMELLGHEGSVLSVSVNEDGSRIVSCGAWVWWGSRIRARGSGFQKAASLPVWCVGWGWRLGVKGGALCS